MKKIALFFVASTIALAMNAQDGKSKPAATTTATPAVTATKVVDTKDATAKPHVCTATCKGGKHVLAHGERGHVCTTACATPAKPADKK
jgi:hypothetical protein